MKNVILPLLSCSLLIGGCAMPRANRESLRLEGRAPAAIVGKREVNVPTELQYLLGTWLIASRDPGTSEVTTVTYKVAPSPGGSWLTGDAESSDLKIRARDSWGIDPASGNILRFVFDSRGAYGIVRSRGWQGDKLLLEGEAQSRGGPMKVRETITRLGPDRFEAVWEALQNGVWKPYAVEQARRQ